MEIFLFSVLVAVLFAVLVYVLINLRTLLLNRHQLPLPPGPRPWPIVGNLPHLGPVPHHSLAALARTYGPLVHLRLGSVHVVVAASSKVAALFLKTHDANFSSRPPNSGAKHIAYNYQDLVFAPYGARWRALRKICAVHLFSAKAMEDFRHLREEEVRGLTCALWKAGGEGYVGLGQLLNVCTTNALGRVMIGKRVFGDIEDGDHREAGEFKEMVVEMMVLAGVFNIGDFIPSLEWLDLQGVAAKMKRLHKRFDTFLDGIIKEHREGGPAAAAHTDLLSVLIGLKDNGDGEGGSLNETEIKALLLNLFTAGTDTSSSTVEWALAELLRHPKILSQAQNELDTVVGPDRLVSESDLAQLPILQAIIKETFRLHPSTPLSLPRMAAESCKIDGYLIPKNTTLLVNVWAIGRDPEVWKDPLQFDPHRFIEGGEAAHIDVRGNDFEVIPFGAGRRICAGVSLGLRMVQFMTASLIHAFDWALEEGLMAEKLNMEEAYGLTLQRAEPLKVRPLPRLAPHVYKRSA